MNTKTLDLLLANDSLPEVREVRKEREMVPDLQITPYAMDRAFTYARLVCEVTGTENECIGYLITPKKNKNRVVRDVYFPKEQDVSSAFVRLSPQDVIKAGEEIDEQGYRVLGWWHSHAGFNAFHSSTDLENHRTVLNAISPVNFVKQINKKLIGNGTLEVRAKNGKIIIYDKNNKALRYEINVEDSSGIDVVSMRIVDEQRLGFAYSLVVHNTSPIKNSGKKKKGKKGRDIQTPEAEMSEEERTIRKGLETRQRSPYAEVAIREYCSDCHEYQDSNKKVPITILDSNGEEVDEKEMKKEVEERVKKKVKTRFYVPRSWKQIYGFRGGVRVGEDADEDGCVSTGRPVLGYLLSRTETQTQNSQTPTAEPAQAERTAPSGLITKFSDLPDEALSAMSSDKRLTYVGDDIIRTDLAGSIQYIAYNSATKQFEDLKAETKPAEVKPKQEVVTDSELINRLVMHANSKGFPLDKEMVIPLEGKWWCYNPVTKTWKEDSTKPAETNLQPELNIGGEK